MINEVRAFMNKHRLLTRNTTVLIGVSGGPDSMALLHFYRSLQKEWDLTIIALSVNHELRGDEGMDDLLYVKRICEEEWDIPFVGTSIDVPSYKITNQLGTQVAARDLRYRFFAEQMAKYQADYLALGHHGDDQVETMLMRLTRAASSRSFNGIPVKRQFASGYIVRPFLCVTKDAIYTYCKEYNITPRVDPSNAQTDYTRNYYRKYVIPILKKKNNNIHRTVQYLSESLHDDEDYLQKQAKEMVSNVVEFDKNEKKILFEIDRFKSFPTALQRRAYHLILNYLYKELPKNLSYTHEEAFFTLLENNKGNAHIDFPHHLKVVKSYQNLVFCFQKQNPQGKPFHEILNIPGDIKLPDGSMVSATYSNKQKSCDIYSYICGVEHIALPLHIRTRKPGDRMYLKGLAGSKKIKDIFIDAKIPLHKRDTWPILTDNNGQILWLIGLRKGKPGAGESITSFIEIKYTNDDM